MSTEKVRELNDRFRQSLSFSTLGKTLITSGVQERFNVEELGIILAKVKNYSDFSEDNDPYGEHDFGNLVIDGEKVYWKIDYYDKLLQAMSSDPSDPSLTTRVLTILLASEY